MIARKSALILVTNVLGGLLGYVGLFFIVRYMGAEALGIIGFALSFVGLFFFISDIYSSAHVKHVSAGNDLGICNGTFILIQTGLVSISVAAVIGAIIVWKFILGRGFESELQEIAVYIILVYLAIVKFYSIITNTFIGRREIAKSQLVMVTETAARTALIIGVAVLALGVIPLASTYVLGALISLIIGLLLFRTYPVKKYTKEYLRSYTSFALPIFLSLVVGAVSMNVDKVMIQLFWSSKDVGYYFSSQKVYELLVVVSGAVGALLFPTISVYHAKGDLVGIREITHAAERYTSMILFPAVVFVILFANPVTCILLSEEFLPAIPILQILSVFALITSLNSPYAIQFIGTGKPQLNAKIAILVTCMNICLNVIFIPNKVLGIQLLGLGAVGAAITTLFSNFIGAILIRYYAKKLTATKSNPRILIHFFAATLSMSILYCINRFYALVRFYDLIMFGLIGLGIYFFFLYLVREFTKRDLDFFFSTLNFRKMKLYISSELKTKHR